MTEDLGARPEAGHLRPDRFDMASHIRSRDEALGLAEPGTENAQGVRMTSHGMPNIGVDRRRSNPYQHFAVARRGPIDLAEHEGVG